MHKCDIHSVATEDDIVVIHFGGDIDISTASRLRAAIILAENNGGSIILEMSNVDFVDATGLGVIVAAVRRALRRNAEFILAAPNSAIKRVFDITGLSKLLVEYGSLDEALAKCRAVKAS